ncbi:nuclear transport factor 2 family protein [Streptomyces luteolus]|uniref:Nuclear transport factor 2 family protein n=1 Tax=Streptomyces luteolus TaxID=3043615 RepID=A0ABT6T3Y3_9ACTN|nr:nuclear transport factor 2 family protein [Streptomyces sp. B-S-A12]MDI3422093.1 nuclear transport factor 2 family protein [Streptomyces sp. B-S-A12]
MNTNEEIIKGIYAAFERRDLEGVLGAFADDVAWVHPEGMSDLGVGGAKQGPDGVREFLSKVPSVMAGQKVEPEEFVIDADRIVVFGSRHVTGHNGATGTFKFIHSWTLREGRVTAMEDTFDTHALRRLLEK